MPFTILNFSVKIVSSFEYRHYLSKIGEGEPHCLVNNELRKEDGHKDRFSSISERINSFTKIKTDFLIAKTALDLCTLKFFLRRFLSKGQKKFEGETLYRAPISVTPSDSEMRKISDPRVFLWVSSEHT